MASTIESRPASLSLEIALSPAGHLLAELSDDAQPKLEAAAVSRLSAAFTASSAHGLELLAADFLHVPLPASLGFWRDLVRRFFTGLCHSPGQENPRRLSVPAPTEAEFTALVETAPPMRGLEYLDAATLTRLWTQLEARVLDQIQLTEGGVAAYLRAQNPVWNAVGRVTFHLAENKRSPEQPFAFLATYTHRVSDAGQAQHIPLGRALQEYAGAQNRAALTTLLSPVQRAAEKSKLARELLDSRAIFHPQAWPPAQAYRFLKEIPLLEQSGIIVRIPDWWKAGRPPRPQVSVQIGDRGASLLGKDGLLDFKVDSDYANRLPRGRTYVRNGSVVDLQIAEGQVTALVSGSELYKIQIQIKPLGRAHWKRVQTECAGQIDSLIEMLQGRLSASVMQVVTQPGQGLFPKPAEIQMDCSCPDWAGLCKHLAAALYGVGARLDEKPELLFQLRGVDPSELISKASATEAVRQTTTGSGQSSIAEADLADVFGIELDTAPEEKLATRAEAPVPDLIKRRSDAALSGLVDYAVDKIDSTWNSNRISSSPSDR